MSLAVVVDFKALGEVFLVSLVAAVGVTTVFSIGIVGITRFDERRRSGGSKIGYGVLTAVCVLVVAAAVVQGILVMTTK
jgi:hypothetical protein